VVGESGDGAPAVLWVRMRQPLVAGRATPPVAHAAFASDFASALAAYLNIARWAYINPDVHLNLLREPASDWIAVDGSTWVGAHGIGHGRAAIHDLDGLVGSASASQVVDRHPAGSGVRTGAPGPSAPATESQGAGKHPSDDAPPSRVRTGAE
jgi:hypothetical protein